MLKKMELASISDDMLEIDRIKSQQVNYINNYYVLHILCIQGIVHNNFNIIIIVIIYI